MRLHPSTATLACALLAFLAQAASAHNTGGPAEVQPIGNGCGAEVEAGRDWPNELPMLGTDCTPAGQWPVQPHVDAARWSSFPCRGATPCAATEAPGGVSGRYVGGTGPVLEVTGGETFIGSNATVVGIAGGPVAPAEAYATITTLCGMEVALGTAPSPADETLVGSTPNPTGQVPDGTWDDGGVAGACHTTTFAWTPFNAPGCPVGDYGMAEDAALGDSVEIAVGCDSVSYTSTAESGPDFLGSVTCAINGALFNGNPPSDIPGVVADCLMPRVDCILHPDDCFVGFGPWCGADGTVDAISYGEGGGHADPADSGAYGEDGVAYPALAGWYSDCAPVGSPIVWTIVGVRAEVPDPAGPQGDGVGVSLSVPTVGWISQVHPA